MFDRLSFRSLTMPLLALAALLFLLSPALTQQVQAEEVDAQQELQWRTSASPLMSEAASATPRPLMLQPRIVNGLDGNAYGVAAVLDSANGSSFCSATLIGCSTVLTAAHCVCFGDGDQCQDGGSQLASPNDLEIYLPQAGIFSVASISVPANYVFGETSDVAILRLNKQVTSVRPYALNTASPVPNGSTALIAGYGITNGNQDDSGIQRYGLVETSACTVVPDNPHVCWRFQTPVGPAGNDSNTCSGDSGGPMFLQAPGALVVAGVTSGGISGDCLSPDSSWDAEVYFDRSFIQNAAAGDLGNTSCGSLPYAFQPDESIIALGRGTLSAGNPEVLYQFDVPAGVAQIRVGLNGEDGPFSNPNDFDLYVNEGPAVSTSNFVCASRRDGTFEYCELVNPQPGTWSFLARRQNGQGQVQLNVTLLFGEDTTPVGDCVPDDTTLCIDADPGDRRFRVTATYNTTQGGGLSGTGKATALAPLGIDRGGIISFFDPTNPELLVKILDGCGNNNHYWVFFAATTNVGFELTVEDTEANVTKVYTNPDINPADAITDTTAFSTCP